MVDQAGGSWTVDLSFGGDKLVVDHPIGFECEYKLAVEGFLYGVVGKFDVFGVFPVHDLLNVLGVFKQNVQYVVGLVPVQLLLSHLRGFSPKGEVQVRGVWPSLCKVHDLGSIVAVVVGNRGRPGQSEGVALETDEKVYASALLQTAVLLNSRDLLHLQHNLTA